MQHDQKRSTRLAQALTAQSDEASHRQTLAALDDYVAAQLAGQDYATRFPTVALHLDACVECAEAYNLLYELALAEATAMLHQPARLPEPDLAFLAPRPKLTLLEQVRAAVQRIGDKISLQLTPELLPGLRPAFAIATVRSPSDEQRYGERLLSLESNEELANDWPVTLTAYRDAHNPALCLVEVTVEPPGRTWPDLEGINVTLALGDEQHTATTDAWGLASFEGVPITGLGEVNISIQAV